jgi:hypothetical protein
LISEVHDFATFRLLFPDLFPDLGMSLFLSHPLDLDLHDLL